MPSLAAGGMAKVLSALLPPVARHLSGCVYCWPLPTWVTTHRVGAWPAAGGQALAGLGADQVLHRRRFAGAQQRAVEHRRGARVGLGAAAAAIRDGEVVALTDPVRRRSAEHPHRERGALHREGAPSPGGHVDVLTREAEAVVVGGADVDRIAGRDGVLYLQHLRGPGLAGEQVPRDRCPPVRHPVVVVDHAGDLARPPRSERRDGWRPERGGPVHHHRGGCPQGEDDDRQAQGPPTQIARATCFPAVQATRSLAFRHRVPAAVPALEEVDPQEPVQQRHGHDDDEPRQAQQHHAEHGGEPLGEPVERPWSPDGTPRVGPPTAGAAGRRFRHRPPRGGADRATTRTRPRATARSGRGPRRAAVVTAGGRPLHRRHLSPLVSRRSRLLPRPRPDPDQPSSGGSRMSTKPSARSWYSPSWSSRMATSRVKTRKLGQAGQLGELVLPEVVGRGLGAGHRVVDERLRPATPGVRSAT